MLPAPTSVVALSSAHAGARPVVVAVKLRYEMQCGWPGPGTVTIRFPAAMTVPRAIPATSVLVQGKPAPSVVSRGRLETIGLPPRKGILCDEIGPGRLTITFTRAARIGNPSAPGVYALRTVKGKLAFAARFVVKR